MLESNRAITAMESEWMGVHLLLGVPCSNTEIIVPVVTHNVLLLSALVIVSRTLAQPAVPGDALGDGLLAGTVLAGTVLAGTALAGTALADGVLVAAVDAPVVAVCPQPASGMSAASTTSDDAKVVRRMAMSGSSVPNWGNRGIRRGGHRLWFRRSRRTNRYISNQTSKIRSFWVSGRY
jgi:hypothetical protein